MLSSPLTPLCTYIGGQVGGGGGLIGVVVSLDATVYVHWWPGRGGVGLIGVVVSLDATVYVPRPPLV